MAIFSFFNKSVKDKRKRRYFTRTPKSNAPSEKLYKNLRQTHALLSSLAIFAVILFAIWWFNPLHVPQNYEEPFNIIDVILFGLVSWIVWHPILMDVVHWTISSHIRDLRQQKPVPGLRVAFITTIVPSNEPLSLLHKCLPAMKKAYYPHDTWLLDEGNDSEVIDICKRYEVKHFSRAGKKEYLTQLGKYTKTKGGNHNSWYDVHGDKYDVVAQIDTDFVPKKTFLTKTLGYFKDPHVAFVGTPQVYGNTKRSIIAQGAAEQQYSFYGSILRGLSGMGMTFLIGANHIIRVKALKDIDHYTAHITEDLITGMKLHTKKWKSIYLSYPLATGEGPFTWESYFNQQMRWAYGCMDILFHHSPKLFTKMGLRRALYYFFLQQHYFSGITMAVSIFLISLYFFAGIRAADIDTTRFLLFYPIITLICWLMSVWLQRFNIHREKDEDLLLAGKIISIAAWPIWFLAFICVMVHKRLVYKVTPKGENSFRNRSSLRYFIPHFTFAAIAIAGIVSSFITQRQNALMLFWAISAALSMLAVPFIESFNNLYLKIKQRILHLIEINHGKGRSIDRKLLVSRRLGTVADVIEDNVFLILVMIWSMMLYIARLGFYSDDWAFLGNFTISRDQSLWGLFQTANTPNTLMRPVQNLYDALLYMLFGFSPLGYHITNAIVLIVIVLLLYHVIRLLNLPRIVALTVCLIYSLLPHYATDRFWYAAFQVNLSMLLYLLSLYAGLRALSLKLNRSLLWKIISIGSLILSALSYEVVLPLFFINMLIFWDPFNMFSNQIQKNKRRSNYLVFNVLILISLVYVFIFKAVTTTRLDRLDVSSNAIRLVVEMFRVNIGVFGIYFIQIWKEAYIVFQDPLVMISSVLLTIIMFSYLFYVVTKPMFFLPSKRFFAYMILLGILLFIAGYSIFFTNNRVGFSPTGIDNRVAIAAALGLAVSVIGAVGLISRLLLPEPYARIPFCFVLTFIAVSGFLVINTLSGFWITAYNRGQFILTDIKNEFPTLPKNSTLLLDGICPYIGPAVVFESQWDLKGALQTMYQDSSLQADVVTPRLTVEEDGITTQIYTFPEKYVYENMFIYNIRRKLVYPIYDSFSANNYFNRFNPDKNNDCPPASAGHGVDVF